MPAAVRSKPFLINVSAVLLFRFTAVSLIHRPRVLPSYDFPIPQILRVLCLWLMEGETKCVEKARSLLKHLYPEGHSGFPLTVWGQELVTCSHVGARRSGKCSPGLGSHLQRNSPTQRKRNTCSDQQLGISASNTKGREIHLVVIEMCMNEVGLHEDTEDH